MAGEVIEMMMMKTQFEGRTVQVLQSWDGFRHGKQL